MKIIGQAQMKAVTSVARIPVFRLIDRGKIGGLGMGGVICIYG